ncbi:alpha-L-fucosidase [Paenibacillus sp. NAIST15-1]|nr:alpha-L-fucosidase [Paenibacillus sp. NAIST15-1]
MVTTSFCALLSECFYDANALECIAYNRVDAIKRSPVDVPALMNEWPDDKREEDDDGSWDECEQSKLPIE